MRENKVAIVQLPQEFYNLDSMQHSKEGPYIVAPGLRGASASWHEQQLFYHVIQPGKDRINATFWCGSPSVLRRRALLDVGNSAAKDGTRQIGIRFDELPAMQREQLYYYLFVTAPRAAYDKATK